MIWGASDGMGWWMVFGSIAWLVFIAVIVFAFVQVFNRGAARHERDERAPAEPPLEIARRRYASGEISEEEFRRIREQLSR
jgi:putative membrane protein